VPVWSQCVKAPPRAGAAALVPDICVDGHFSECELEFIVRAGPIPLETRSYSVQTLKDLLDVDAPSTVERETGVCYTLAGVCTGCVNFTEISVSETAVSACLTTRTSCLGMEVSAQDLGCFEDRDVGPRCFAVCDGGCGDHGTCSAGFCHCEEGWDGPKCEAECPRGCHGEEGRGECTAEGCVCEEHWHDLDCGLDDAGWAKKTGGQASGGGGGGEGERERGKGGEKGGGMGGVVIGVVLLFVGMAIGAGALWWRRRRQAAASPFGFVSMGDSVMDDDEF
jgi:hypothetical protein